MKKTSLRFVLLLGLSCSSIALAGGPDVGPSHLHRPEATTITRSMHLAPFDHIKAAGYFQLYVTSRGAGKSNQVTVVRDTPARLMVKVRDRTLYIASRYSPLRGYPEPRVTVRVPRLQSIAVAGPTGVVGKSIRSDGLTIKSSGYGNLTFSNTPQIDQINQIRNNIINISGVDNDTLTVIEAGFGEINLGGYVDRLYARVFDESTLNARKLKARHIYIQAKDESRAYITPKKSLRAFAAQSANIYYYKYMNHLTRYSVESGNVFQMKW